MTTETTYLKKKVTATAGGSDDSINEMNIQKSSSSIYQHRYFIIVAGSLLAALLGLVAVAGKNGGGQDFESIVAYEIDTGVGGGVVEAVDSIVVPATTTSTDSALNMDIFGIAANSDTSGCVGKYHVCAGAGQGNCCNGLECDGPLFGTCQTASCQKKYDVCAGFGKGNCCDGLQCSTVGFPGAGTCQSSACVGHGHICGGGGDINHRRGNCCEGLECHFLVDTCCTPDPVNGGCK